MHEPGRKASNLTEMQVVIIVVLVAALLCKWFVAG